MLGDEAGDRSFTSSARIFVACRFKVVNQSGFHKSDIKVSLCSLETQTVSASNLSTGKAGADA